MKRMFILFVCAFATAVGYAASFDCQKANGYIENEICSNSTLGKLDKEMAQLYFQYRQNLGRSDAAVLLRDQRHWNDKREKECPTERFNDRCLIDMYKKRITELRDRIEKRDLPSLSDVEEVCQRLASSTPSQRMSFGGALGDINNDGVRDHQYMCVSGTKKSDEPCVMYVDDNHNPLYLNEEKVLFERYGIKASRYVGHKGRQYKLASRDNNYTMPAYLSYTAPDNREYVMCEFDNHPLNEMRTNPNENKAQAVCKSFAKRFSITEQICSGSPPNLCFDLGVGAKHKELGAHDVISRKRGNINYDNDDIIESVMVIDYSQSRAQQCHPNEIFVNDKFDDAQDLMLKVQHIEPADVYANCGNVVNGFVKHGDVTFFVQKVGAHYRVSYISDRNIHDVCEFDLGYRTVVDSVGLPAYMSDRRAGARLQGGTLTDSD